MSPFVIAIVQRDPAIAAWWGTRTECASAITRKAREGHQEIASAAEAELHRLAGQWFEIEPVEEVRVTAERLLWSYSLRAADAFQLAAALAWCGGRPASMEFVSLDARLRGAALDERFTILPRDLPSLG